MASTHVHADAGRVVAEQIHGGTKAVLFVSPFPATAGPAEFAVYLSDVSTAAAITDAEVYFRMNKLSAPTPDLAWKGPGCIAPGSSVAARRGHSGNRLLHAASFAVPEPGLWELAVDVGRGGATATFAFPLEIIPAPATFWNHWPLLTMVPLGIAIYALRNWLLRRRTHAANP